MSPLVLLPLLLAPALAAAESRPPNIVLVLADDLGTAPVAAYGNRYYQTPHLDRLSREGTRFDAAYSACPVCSPTRAAIMTGQYPARTRVTDFIPGGDFPPRALGATRLDEASAAFRHHLGRGSPGSGLRHCAAG